jgi:cobaltochelatase CobT
MTRPAEAFFSYSVVSDQADDGALHGLHRLLEGEVRQQLGDRHFSIFLDKRDLQFGVHAQAKIEASLRDVRLLIPVVSPLFFESAYCRKEVELFLARERALGRDDLILPIYYIESEPIDAPPAGDLVAATLRERQWLDWRELRYEPHDDPRVRRSIAAFARRIRDVLRELRKLAPAAPPAPPPAPATTAGASPPAVAPGPRHPQASAKLHQLLLSLFSTDELRRFVRYNIDGHVHDAIAWQTSPSQAAFDTITALEQGGYIDAAFFAVRASWGL